MKYLHTIINESKSTFLHESVELGKCYMSAYQAITSFKYDDSWKLVHGIAKLTRGHQKGKEFGHAWIENDEEVFDTETGKTIAKAVYYYAGKISYTREYTSSEAMEEAMNSGHYGPWDKKIWNA
jgi:hypothetical protein